ncbi:MAG: hypothetical protein H0V70_19050 [Ktedonobacteraceae bacterium]|nr:hypothetical protein [Ktedonobacteraceae bacterium]
MPESIIRSAKDHNEETIENSESSANLPEKGADIVPLIIWTPGFILRFTLVLIVGLSVAGLLTEGWVNGYYPSEWTELAYTILAFACWFALFLSANSLWVRLGSGLSIIWTGFMGIHFCITLLIVRDQTYTIIAHVVAATNIALAGSYVCLSIAYILFKRWDTWFFRLAPIATVIVIVLVYHFSPPQTHTLRGLENSTAEIALALSLCIWWLRPSCWKTQPGPTFLLGMIPLLELFFSMSRNYTEGEPVFFTLVALLLSALAAMRIMQREQQYAKRV